MRFILTVIFLCIQAEGIFGRADLCKAKDSDACLKASGKNWLKYTCSRSTKWCKSWGKDMKRCCPESCRSGSFFKSDCEKDGGKGSCKYQNEAQPNETPCKKDDSFECTPWPSSGCHGCSAEGSWTKLDGTTVEASGCKHLCLQHASGEGCCFVNTKGGCWWREGAKAESSKCDNTRLSITCSPKIDMHCQVYGYMDSDSCLESSPGWTDYTCKGSSQYCKTWDKDMKRCCPYTCGTGVFTEADCNSSSGKGTCKYPNEAECNVCNPNPCYNGGTCSIVDEKAKCLCPDGYSGNHCEITPCTCIDKMYKGYGNCKKAYSTKGKCGNLCYVDESADCDDREWSDSAKAWYSWKACPGYIDPCSDSQRKNGGTCVDNQGVRECKCPYGFNGKNCDEKIELEACNPNSLEACKAIGKKEGWKLKQGNYDTAGCYKYTDAYTKATTKYGGMLFYGTGNGTKTNKLSGGRYRPRGHDCKSECEGYIECNLSYPKCLNGICHLESDMEPVVEHGIKNTCSCKPIIIKIPCTSSCLDYLDGRPYGKFGGFGNCLLGKPAFTGTPICYVTSDSMCEDKVYDPEVDKHYSWKARQKFKVLWSGKDKTVKYVVGNGNTLCEKGQVDTEEECIKAAKELEIDFVRYAYPSSFPGGCSRYGKTATFNKNLDGKATRSGGPICRKEKGMCSDYENWKDRWGYTCFQMIWFGHCKNQRTGNRSPETLKIDTNMNGDSALDACCACGGGEEF